MPDDFVNEDGSIDWVAFAENRRQSQAGVQSTANPVANISALTGTPIPVPGPQTVTPPQLRPEFGLPGVAFPSTGFVPSPDLNDSQYQRFLAYVSTVGLPFLQFQQNAQDSNRDFNEAQRRFDAEFPHRQRVDFANVFGRTRLPQPRFLSIA